MLELGFNSSVQASTQRSPFELLYGTPPRLPIDVAVSSLRPQVPAAATRVERMRQALDFARGRLLEAQQRQAENADRHRRSVSLAVGDDVLLATEGLQLRHFTNKLCSKYIGPFPIAQVVNANAYKLKLPPQLRALHPTFNISRLKRYIDGSSRFPSRPVTYDRPPPTAEADSNGDAEFEVERIVARKRAGRGYRYLVQWKGYPPEENTWEPRSALQGAKEALADFEALQMEAEPEASSGDADVTSED